MKTIGIISAMPSELAGIKTRFAEAAVERISGFDFYVDCKNNRKTVFVCSGIAKVNAAVCTQILIDSFKPDAVINAGIAGGMDDRVGICDIVISSEVVAHDLDLRLLSDFPPYCGIFKADSYLTETAENICRQQNINYFTGRIASGETFVTDNEKKKDIKDRLSPYAVDMESSAVGHCAFLNELPFISIKCISDNADNEGKMSYEEFKEKAAEIVAVIVVKMSEKI